MGKHFSVNLQMYSIFPMEIEFLSQSRLYWDDVRGNQRFVICEQYRSLSFYSVLIKAFTVRTHKFGLF